MFKWDEEKAALNWSKHGVSFEEAQTVFDDPFFLVYQDTAHSLDEARYLMLGISAEWRVLIVAYTERGNSIRIISARETDSQEQQFYEEEKYR